MNSRAISLFFSALFILFVTLNVSVPAVKNQTMNWMSQQVSDQYNQEVQCLAENIYYESAHEPYEGKLGVAQVTMNRVHSGKFPSTVCGVVRQKDKINGYIVCQFSWFCNTINKNLLNKYEWEESLFIAHKALSEPYLHDALYRNNALYYHAVYIHPGWRLTVVKQIGNHIFYRE
jgi:spore germination cell wall hydrolase CwlJ-like protein